MLFLCYSINRRESPFWLERGTQPMKSSFQKPVTFHEMTKLFCESCALVNFSPFSFSNTLSFFFASANLKILFLIENFLAGKLKTCHDWCTIEYYSYFFSFCLLLCSIYLHTLIKITNLLYICKKKTQNWKNLMKWLLTGLNHMLLRTFFSLCCYWFWVEKIISTLAKGMKI